MDFPIFLMLAYSGMRVGELVSLQWDDINFKMHTIRIIKTYYNPKNITRQFSLGTPKTTGSARTIAIEPVVIDALKDLKVSQEKVKNRLGDAYADQNFVFAKTDRHPGYPILIKTVENRMKRLLKLAGLNELLSPHSLRHTHTSLLAESDKVSLEEIMKRLGHTDDITTRLFYHHVTKVMNKKASQAFGEHLRSHY